MSQRSDVLADRLEQGARALAKFASALSDTEWHSAVTKEAALDLLYRNSAAAAVAGRALTDEQLDRAALVSLNGDAPLTCPVHAGGSRRAA
jgi:hypothetical protein